MLDYTINLKMVEVATIVELRPWGWMPKRPWSGSHVVLLGFGGQFPQLLRPIMVLFSTGVQLAI